MGAKTAVASTAAKKFAKALGMGAYKVSHNTITNPGSYHSRGVDQIPLMHNDIGTTRVRHREYVRDVPSSTDFQNITFRIQPTNTALFPWLSALAQNYEQYKILGLIFEFRSLSANALNSVNTALGSVSMATQYNALDTPFVNKQQVLNYQFGTSCKPSESMIHPLECDPQQTPNQPLYIAIGNAEPGDARLYDFGILNYVTIGMQQANVTIGELWVSYDILLIKPRISSGLGLTLETALYSVGGQGSELIGDNAPIGLNAERQFDSIGLQIQYQRQVTPTAVDGIISWPIGSEGLYIVYYSYPGNGTAQASAQSAGDTIPTNCSFVSDLILPLGDEVFGVQQGVTGCIVFTQMCLIRITDPNKVASLRFVAGTGWVQQPGTVVNRGQLLVQQLNNGLSPGTLAAITGHFSAPPLSFDEQKVEVEFLTDADPEGQLAELGPCPPLVPGGAQKKLTLPHQVQQAMAPARRPITRS